MERIGRYKVIKELARGPWGRVAQASLAEDDAGKFAIKLEFRSALEDLSRGLSGEPAASVRRTPTAERPSVRSFFERSQLQKQAAAVGRHWAPVHDVGTHGDAVYYVSDFYRHNASFFVSAKIKLPPWALHRILSEIMAGLDELREACHRAHGNLKLANVLLDGKVSGGQICVRLTDPSTSVVKPASFADDAYGLGEILFQLVTFRGYRSYNWPVPESEEWSRLGRNARQWRELCNDLLNPDVHSRLDVDGLRRRLASRKRKEQAPRKLALAGSVILVASVSAAWVGHSREASADREISIARHAWLNSLMENSDRLGTYQDVLKKPAIGDDEMERLHTAFNLPKAGFPGFGALHKKREALELISEIHGRLAQVYQTSVATLGAKVAEYQKQGWRQPVELLNPLIIPQPASPDLVAEIEEVRNWNQFLGENPGPHESWGELQQKLSDMGKNADPDLVRFASTLRGSAGESVRIENRHWRDRIAEEIQLADDVLIQGTEVKVWPRDFDRERLIHEESPIDLSHPKLADVRKWASRVRWYAFVNAKDRNDPKINSLQAELSAIENERGKDSKWFKDPADQPKYEALAHGLQEQIQKITEQRFVLKDFDAGGRFAEQCNQIASAIPLLRQFKRPVPDISIQLAKLEANTQLTSPNIAAYWKEQLKSLGPAENIPPADREIVLRNSESLAGALKQLDKSLPLDQTRAFQEPWLTAARVERENRIAMLLREVGNTGTMLNDSTLNSQNVSFSDWCVEVVKLSKQFPLGTSILELSKAMLLQTEWSGNLNKAFWNDHVLARTSPLYPIVEKDLARLLPIQKIGESSDRRWLIELASNPRADEEIVLAAWDRLNQTASSATVPASPQDLRDLAATIANARAKLSSPRLSLAQRQQRSSDLQQISVRIWVEAANACSSPETLASLWELRNQFAVNNADFGKGKIGLSPVARLDLWLVRLRAGASSRPDPNTLAELTQAVDALSPADASVIKPLRDALHAPAKMWEPTRSAILATQFLWSADEPRRQSEFARSTVFDAARKLWNEGKPSQAIDSLKSVREPDARSLEKEIQESVRTATANQNQGMELWNTGQYVDAFAHFQSAARGGNVAAMMNMAGMLRAGQGTRVDPQAARAWFLRAADGGLAQAMVEVGRLYESEPSGRAEAIRWYTKAAELQSVTAEARLIAMDVRAGAIASATDRITAAERIEAAQPGNRNVELTNAMTDLARFFENGNNPAMAKDWYNRAANRKGEIAMQWVKRHQTATPPKGENPLDKVQQMHARSIAPAFRS